MNLLDLNNKVKFYEDSQKVKDRIMRSESERLQLEKELYLSINSNKNSVRAKAAKLQAYYKKLCDEEKLSNMRNQQILADLARVESQFQHLETKLQRLATLKLEHERYIKQAYPSWDQIRENIITNNTGDSLINPTPNNNKFGINALVDSISIAKNDSNRIDNKIIDQNSSYSIQKGIEMGGQFYNQIGSYLTNSSTNTNQQRPNDISDTYTKPPNNNRNPYEQNTYGIQNLVIQPKQNETQIISNTKSSGEVTQKNNNEFNNKIVEALISSANPTLSTSGNRTTFANLAKPGGTVNISDTYLKEYENDVAMRDTNYMIPQQQANANYGISNLIDANPIIQNPNNANRNQQPSWISTPQVRNFDDIQRQEQPQANNNSEPNEFRRRKSLRQELNISSLFLLLDHVEDDMRHTIHPQKYYRQEIPHYKSKLEIIKCARENESLKDLDAGNVSMVILDQLPTVIRKHTKNKCLITRDILAYSVADINEEVIRKHINPKDLEVWKRLLTHWCILKRFNAIDSQTLANLFAPSLIAEDGYGLQKAVQFLEKIINLAIANADNDKSYSENSITYEHLHVDPKLKQSDIYQNFIQKTVPIQNQFKKQFSDDEDIDKLVAPKGLQSGTLSSTSTSVTPKQPGRIIARKSPRDSQAIDDFSQSTSDKKNDDMIVYLNPSMKSLRSRSPSKEKLPAGLRDYLDSDTEDSDNTTNLKSGMDSYRNKQSNHEFDFYN